MLLWGNPQPVEVLSAIFNCGIGAGPSAAEDRVEAKLRKGAYRLRHKQRIQWLELSILETGSAAPVDCLPKLDKVLDVLVGKMMWLVHAIIVQLLGGRRNPRTAFAVYLKSSSKGELTTSAHP